MKLFGVLYWRWFGDGQAYRSPRHYALADALSILAGYPNRPPNTTWSRVVDVADDLCTMVAGE